MTGLSGAQILGKDIAANSIRMRKLSFPDPALAGTLCGEHNANLQRLEKRIGLSIHVRGNHFTLEGGEWELDLAERVLRQLYELLRSDYPVYANDVEYAIRILSGDESADLKKIFMDRVYVASGKTVIAPKSLNQKEMVPDTDRYQTP